MATQVQFRGGTTAQNNAFTGASKELTVDTTKDVVVVHDGSTAGGHPLMAEDGSNSSLALGSAGTPSLKWDSNTGIYSPGGDKLAISTGGTQRVYFHTNGFVGMGTQSPEAQFHIAASSPRIQFTDTDTNVDHRFNGDSSVGSLIIDADFNQNNTNSGILYKVRATDVAKIASDGKHAIGHTNPQSQLDVVGSFNYTGTTPNRSSYDFNVTSDNKTIGIGVSHAMPAIQGSGTGTGYGLLLQPNAGNLGIGLADTDIDAKVHIRADGNQVKNFLLLQNKTDGSSTGGQIAFINSDSDLSNNRFAYIRCNTSGTGEDGNALRFATNPSGGNAVERVILRDDGTININTSNNNPQANNVVGTAIRTSGSIITTADDATPLIINRKTSDGPLIQLHQDSIEEGTIQVDGGTVTFNGAHLSRWSQLPGGAERIEILRGSVLSNIDEMCEWGEEDNEQLNRMQVSTVEGDPNVSGVFQGWDDTDAVYTNDFYCAMTGDFVIRIAQGVTVQRGDLLISAGDGTAKAQDDDIIRSKTIAKVTSTNVSCTYEDGSYCVPCVLMAC